VCTLTHATAVLAHTTSTGLATLTVTGSRLTYRLTLVLGELSDAPAQLFTAAVTGDASSVDRVAVMLRQSVQVRADDRMCRAGRATLQGSHLGEARVTLALTLHCPASPAQLVIHDDWCDVLGEHYRTLARIEGPGGVHQVAFLPEAREVTVAFNAETPQHDTSFFWLGVEHILTGYDHLLFLTALLLRGGHLLGLMKIVTAFTLAHSLTLALAVLGLVRMSDRVVESVIAASIAWVALENLARCRVPSQRWVVSLLFGLVHGFGFASALRPLALPSWNLAMALVGFNLGVEVAQGVVLAALLPVLTWFSHCAWQPRFVRTISVILAMIGIIWCVQRLLGVFEA
jgi:hydrogenase/urease accessory protein HupE